MSGARQDARLLDVPMQLVSCGTCAAPVEVRKSSWDQTSIQWHADSSTACLERRASSRTVFEGCTALRDTIREAAVRGTIPVAES